MTISQYGKLILLVFFYTDVMIFYGYNRFEYQEYYNSR